MERKLDGIQKMELIRFKQTNYCFQQIGVHSNCCDLYRMLKLMISKGKSTQTSLFQFKTEIFQKKKNYNEICQVQLKHSKIA